MTVTRLTRSAAQLLALVDPDAAVLDLYSAAGADVYAAITVGDYAEVREVLDVARRTRGSILELACGAGRLTLPLARLGRAVVAVDNSARMLELLSARSASAAITNVNPLLGDMASIDLDERFGLIVLATTSIALLSAIEREALLDAVRRHLAPDGRFLVAVDASPPSGKDRGALLMPLLGGEQEIAVIDEEIDREHGYRDVSIVRLRRVGDQCRAEAYSSRVHLLDGEALIVELRSAGLTVVDVRELVLSDGVRGISMIECTR